MPKEIEQFVILREYKPEATLGHLLDSSQKAIIATLEPPRGNNAKDDPNTIENEARCIPEGIYTVRKRDPKKYKTARFKDNWEILNVPSKDGVVFHSGTYWTDSKSCILTATTILNMNPKNDLNSDPNKKWLAAQGKDALKKFGLAMPDVFRLKITSKETDSLCNV